MVRHIYIYIYIYIYVIRRLRVNFLEPSGSLQACNGTAVLLPFFNITLQFLLVRSLVLNCLEYCKYFGA